MFIAVTCIDKPDQLETRLANRDAHLSYVADTGKVKIAGPLLSDDGETMCGSLIILDVDDIAAAKDWCENDPYAKAGLFDRVEIRPWKWVVGAPDDI